MGRKPKFLPSIKYEENPELSSTVARISAKSQIIFWH
jgi:hypothetical protein